MEELIKEIYKDYCNSNTSLPEDPNGKSGLLAPQLYSLKPIQYPIEQFWKEIMINPDFAKKWGVVIITKILDLNERCEIKSKKDGTRNTYAQAINSFSSNEVKKWMDEDNIPNYSLIISYKSKSIEIPQYKTKDTIIQIQSELIELLTNQIVDLVAMSKIELGDDVLEEIKRLRNLLN